MVIDDNGENKGQMKLEDAIRAAKEKELDLVCVAPNAKIPVCRYMDYRKYCYDCKVKISLYYPRGKKRLLQMDSSTKILERFVEALSDVAVVESTTMQGDKKTGILLTTKKTK